MRNPNLRTRILILLLLVLSYCVLTWLAISGRIAAFESGVYSALSQFITPAVISVMIFVTNMGSSVVIIAVTSVLLALPFTRKAFGVPAAANTVVSAALTAILKMIVARDRPDILRLVVESGFGFPSGHALNSTALCTMILLIVFRLTKSKKFRIPVLVVSIALPILIGISRVYLGVHNAGDVLAGWIMGVAVALFVDTIFQHLYDRRKTCE